MTTYLITGASRGLGYAFLTYLSRNPSNTVIGLVRNTTATLQKIESDNLNTASNIHTIEGDISSYASLQKAYTKIASIVPKIDILINNAAALSSATAFTKLTSHQNDPETLLSDLQLNMNTNVIGVVMTINIFLPLVLKSDIKKVVAISSGLADDSLTNKFDLYEAGPYSMAKAALNTAVAKYNAAHGKNTDGVLFLSLAPGLVDTGNDAAPPPDSNMPQKFALYAPYFRGPITPAESVELCVKVINRASVEDEQFAGQFVSQFGNKVWL